MYLTLQRTITLAFVALASSALGQDEVAVFRTEARSAYVWGEDVPQGAISSTVQDPLTGNAILKLSHSGIEVSSQIGFEKIEPAAAGIFLSYTTTVVNDTDQSVSTRYGGVTVDGLFASPVMVTEGSQDIKKKNSKGVWPASKMHCFESGFLARQNFFSSSQDSKVFVIGPRAAITVSFVIRDPRSYPLRCSTEGCRPTGTTRYHINVDDKDYVFNWPGRSAVYCGQ